MLTPLKLLDMVKEYNITLHTSMAKPADVNDVNFNKYINFHHRRNTQKNKLNASDCMF